MEDRNGREPKHMNERRHSFTHPAADTGIAVLDDEKEKKRSRYEKARLFRNRQGWSVMSSVEQPAKAKARENAFNRRCAHNEVINGQGQQA